jgi:polyketide biosynthesis enoyl-CoA hydratase PksI
MYSAQLIEPRIWQITIDDGQGVNSLRPDDPEPILHLLAQAHADPETRVVLIRGRQDVFLTGADAVALRDFCGSPARRRQTLVNHLSLGKVVDFQLPVIGALEGHAVGGGLAFALALCDITVAAEGSRYGFNFSDLGFTPGMATTSLVPALVGHSFANEMILTGKRYRGSELAGRGLFTHVLPKERVLPHALDVARRMTEIPRRTLELMKGTLASRRLQLIHAARVDEELMHKLTLDDPALQERLRETFVGSTDAFKPGAR